jgi:hypothetical protein
MGQSNNNFFLRKLQGVVSWFQAICHFVNGLPPKVNLPKSQTRHKMAKMHWLTFLQVDFFGG